MCFYNYLYFVFIVVQKQFVSVVWCESSGHSQTNELSCENSLTHSKTLITHHRLCTPHKHSCHCQLHELPNTFQEIFHFQIWKTTASTLIDTIHFVLVFIFDITIPSLINYPYFRYNKKAQLYIFCEGKQTEIKTKKIREAWLTEISDFIVRTFTSSNHGIIYFNRN